MTTYVWGKWLIYRLYEHSLGCLAITWTEKPRDRRKLTLLRKDGVLEHLNIKRDMIQLDGGKHIYWEQTGRKDPCVAYSCFIWMRKWSQYWLWTFPEVMHTLWLSELRGKKPSLFQFLSVCSFNSSFYQLQILFPNCRSFLFSFFWLWKKMNCKLERIEQA